MISDYYKPLTLRMVTETKSDTSSQPVITTSDSPFEGFISVMNSYEVYVSMMQKVNATAKLFTELTIAVTSRIVDSEGYFSPAGAVFEVVGTYNDFSKYYDLKKVL